MTAAMDEEGGEAGFCPDLQRLIDLAATVGYSVAKAEAAPALARAANRTRPATTARRKISDPVRDAAKTFILSNPKTTQSACARHLAGQLGKDQRSIEKLIAPLFSWVTLPGGAKEKRAQSWLTTPRRFDDWPGLYVREIPNPQPGHGRKRLPR